MARKKRRVGPNHAYRRKRKGCRLNQPNHKSGKKS